MKDKILNTEITAACERIARALRQYTDKPMTCEVIVETHDGEPVQDTDFYSIEVSFAGKDTENVDIINQGVKVNYSFDPHEGEKIRNTEVIFGGIEDE